MSEILTLADVVDYLNEIIETDPSVLMYMMLNRVGCSETLANHPRVQVLERDGAHWVGFLGLLNGLFENYRIVFCFDNGKLVEAKAMPDSYFEKEVET